MPKKTILVTGAEGALGTHVVERFLATDARVFGTHHPKVSPPSTAPNGPTWLSMDVTNSESIQKGLSAVGEVDTLIHCAGGFRFAEIAQTTDDDLDFLLNVNLRSAILLLREVLPRMKKRNFGRVVLISSRATQNAPAGLGVYAASKAGLNAIVSSVADEVRSFDININAVLPTVIDTPANRKAMPDADYSAWVSPAALSEIIFSLTQPWGKPVNGALIPVAGRL